MTDDASKIRIIIHTPSEALNSTPFQILMSRNHARLQSADATTCSYVYTNLSMFSSHQNMRFDIKEESRE
jgi:hypothetical protein